MSIPKEPRQLMINLMYLVLTAMLALNVSAKIIQAFFTLDKGLQKSNALTDDANNLAEASLNKQLENPVRIKFKPLIPIMAEIRKASADFCKEIDQIRLRLIEESGGMMQHDGHEQPRGYKNKDITTRILIDENKGVELAEKVQQTLNFMVSNIKEKVGNSVALYGITSDDFNKKMKNFEEQLPLRINQADNPKQWAINSFRQMPLASVLPMLTKLQTDAKVTESMLVSYLAQLANTTPDYVDRYFPVMDTKASYVIEGEPFEANFSVSSSSSLVSNVSMSVNGQSLSVNDGIASFKTIASGIGSKSINVKADVKNPVTGEITSVTKQFNYEVGQRSAVVQAEKMNVIYAGVENPIAVSVAGAPSSSIKVRAEGLSLNSLGNGKYSATASAANPNAAIFLSANGMPESKFTFRVKRIPNPTLFLLNKKGGPISSGEVKAAKGLSVILENFDFEAKCDCESFQFYYAEKNGNVVFKSNQTAVFNSDIKTILGRAKAGDNIFFSDIMVKCPGDTGRRDLGSLAFRVN